MTRKLSAAVELKVRLKERLRRQIEGSARRNGLSLNGETVGRLQRSFHYDEALKFAGLGEDYIAKIIDSELDGGTSPQIERRAAVSLSDGFLRITLHLDGRTKRTLLLSNFLDDAIANVPSGLQPEDIQETLIGIEEFKRKLDLLQSALEALQTNPM